MTESRIVSANKLSIFDALKLSIRFIRKYHTLLPPSSFFLHCSLKYTLGWIMPKLSEKEFTRKKLVGHFFLFTSFSYSLCVYIYVYTINGKVFKEKERWNNKELGRRFLKKNGNAHKNTRKSKKKMPEMFLFHTWILMKPSTSFSVHLYVCVDWIAKATTNYVHFRLRKLCTLLAIPTSIILLLLNVCHYHDDLINKQLTLI